MRVSTGMIFDAGVNTINRQTASLLHLQQQVASGRRILKPSDDPVAAARTLEVTQSQDVLAQFKSNHDNANSALGMEEAQLSSSGDLLARIRELTVQAGNTHLADSDRRAIAFEMRARYDELVGIANTTDGSGQYVFSGYMGSTKPFSGTIESILAGNEITYSGDDGQRKLQISPTRFLEVSDSGNDVFKRIANGNGYFVTNYAVNAGSGLPTNTGLGIIDGGTVTDPAKWNAATNGASYQVKFYVDSSVTPSATYYDIIDTSTGFPTSGQSMITGGAPTVPTSGPPSTFPGGLRLFTPDQAISLSTQQVTEPAFDLGASVLISGAPADGDSFTLAASTSQSVFSTIGKLVGALENAKTGTSGGVATLANDIGFALTNFDQATENILRVRAQIGSRMGEIDSIASVNEDLSLQYQQTLSQLQDLDYAKAITDMQRKQLDLEAAQKSFMTTSKLSLFNYI